MLAKKTKSKDQARADRPPSGIMISDAQYTKLASLVYSLCGINLGTSKKELLKARLVKRLRATGISDVRAYMNYLQQDADGSELISFLDCITTNKTDFFRENQHFEFLANDILPNLNKLCGPSAPLRIWSAACSTGEEPYTLSIVLLENQSLWKDRGAGILASDISTKVLSHGKNGVYALERLVPIPKPILRTYFQRGVNRWEGHGRVRPQVKSLVEFKRINLMEPFSFEKAFHVIFCRNVMIYFDKPTREKLVGKFGECLVPGGYLFVGHSESLTGIEHKLKFVRPAVYRREV
jgi:chemotaxis protein methyltransferase CheR